MRRLTRAEIGALADQFVIDRLVPLGPRVLTSSWRGPSGELVRIGRRRAPQRSVICGGVLMALGRAYSVAVPGWTDTSSRSRPTSLWAAWGASGRPARRRAAGVAGPGPRGDHQLRQEWPMARVILALSPATLPKVGSVYDVALAAAVLRTRQDGMGAAGQDGAARRARPRRTGAARPGCAARSDGSPARRLAGRGGAVDSLAEAGLVDGIEVWGARTLGQVQSWFAGKANSEPDRPRRIGAGACGRPQRHGRAGRSPCARGGRCRRTSPDVDRTAGGRQNNAGTTTSGLLPPLSRQEALEVTAMHSVAGLLPGTSR